MIELEDVDLAKALDMLAKAVARMARDIPLELDTPERGHEVAGLLEETARLVRWRAMNTAPKVVELHAAGEMSNDDRLAAGLALLAYQLTMIAPEMRAGFFDQAERNDLADILTTLARDLRG